MAGRKVNLRGVETPETVMLRGALKGYEVKAQDPLRLRKIELQERAVKFNRQSLGFMVKAID